jgi:hypothetical protein
VQAAGGDVSPVPLDAVASVQFAATPGSGNAAATAGGFRLRLNDGSSVVAADLTLAGGKLEIALAPGGPKRPLDLGRVAAIEQVNGPASWLPGRVPSESVFVPFFGTGQDFPARTDATVDGSRDLRFGGRQFRRAIGVHAYSKLVYPLDGSYAAFRTQYAIAENLRYADVTVRVKLDDRVVHEQQGVRAGALSPVVTVDLGAAKSLTLEVDFGDTYDVQDDLHWVEPALLAE